MYQDGTMAARCLEKSRFDLQSWGGRFPRLCAVKYSPRVSFLQVLAFALLVAIVLWELMLPQEEESQ
jgi:hypothetical protein